MLYCVISDIHSNLEALNAVLHAASLLPVDTLLCLGDLVGYNADPDPCVERTASRAARMVRGNHDKAVTRRLSLQWFNKDAREAALWTRRSIKPETLRVLASLPEGPVETGDGIIVCHGTPMDEDRYLDDSSSIAESFDFLDGRFPTVRYCLHGHTHVPLVARKPIGGGKARLLPADEETSLDEGSRYLINPGSVGQPRDGNNMASFGILDTERKVYRPIRVAYGLRETQRKILAAGLPRGLAQRLEEGR